MARLVRMCTQCGALDARRTWDTPQQAADDGAFKEPWACSTCAWTEFDLVEAADAAVSDDDPGARAESERATVSAGTGGGGGIDPTFRSPV